MYTGSMIGGYLAVAIVSYLLGSINSALLVAHLLKKDDIRRYGSGNAGATNMFRVYGHLPALLTVLGDLGKTVCAVLLSRLIFSYFGLDAGFDIGYFAGLFAIVGHVFPLYFRFAGGKGVLAAVSVILIVNPLVFLVMALLALFVFWLKRTMSVVSLVNAVLLAPVVALVGWLRSDFRLAEIILTAIYSFMVIVSHRDNIRRLLAGSEKPTMPPQKKD